MRGSHADALGTADDPEYGEVTGAFIRAAQGEHKATADALLNGEPAGPHYLAAANRQALADANGRGHARTRVPRFRFRRARRQDPPPVSQLLAAEDDEPGEFTGVVSEYAPEALPAEAFARPATAEPREDEAAARVVAERADLARMFVPPEISAVPWGLWDSPAHREPMRYVPDLTADLTDLPGFREALGRRTRSRASQCLCGTPVTGQTWGERMVRAGHHLLAPAEIAAFTFGAAPRAAIDVDVERTEWDGTTIGWGGVQVRTPDGTGDALNRADAALAAGAGTSGTEPAPGTPEPPEIATAMEACDALNPVPAAVPQEHPRGHFTGIGAETTWHPREKPPTGPAAMAGEDVTA
jgi:hypothetical protein